MPRMSRIELSNYPIYLEHGSNKQIFKSPEDYSYYISQIQHYCRNGDIHIHSYCILPSKIKLLVTTLGTKTISQLMQYLSKSYTHYYNKRYESTGSLWHGKYRSTLINPDEYLIDCCHHIEHSPIAMVLSSNSLDYRWSSYHSNARHYINSSDHGIYKFNNSQLYKGDLHYIKSQWIDNDDAFLRKLNSALNGGWVLGNDEFCQIIQRKTKRRTFQLKRGGNRKKHDQLITNIQIIYQND